MSSGVTSRSVYQLEYLKAQCDYLKHLTTVAIGSILLLIGFLEKVIAHPRWRLLVAVSLICFALTVICSVRAHTSVVDYMLTTPEPIPKEEWDRDWDHIERFWRVAWISFMLGVVALVAFGIKNLF